MVTGKPFITMFYLHVYYTHEIACKCIRVDVAVKEKGGVVATSPLSLLLALLAWPHEAGRSLYSQLQADILCLCIKHQVYASVFSFCWKFCMRLRENKHFETRNATTRNMDNPRKSFSYDHDPRGLPLLEENERYARMSDREYLPKFRGVSKQQCSRLNNHYACSFNNIPVQY